MKGVEITVVDAMMGCGKTSAAINYMEDNCDTERFLYITPYLEESERIKNACVKCRFQTPCELGTKLKGIKELLAHGANIASTHALFGILDEEALKLVRSKGYVLMMDEVYDVVGRYRISGQDIGFLMDYIRCDKYGFLHWNTPAGADDYTGELFRWLKRDIDCQTVIAGGVGEDEKPKAGEPFFKVVPVKSFSSFSKIFVLTYMFNGSIQKAYFDYFGMAYRTMGIKQTPEGYFFSEEAGASAPPVSDIKSLITLWDGGRAKDIGRKKGTLSYSWYLKRGADHPDMIRLQHSITNFYVNVAKTRSNRNLWTTFNSSRKKLTGGGYAKGFEAHNARATNKHRDRTAVVYAVNKYINPAVKSFFRIKGIELDENRYALSSMVQFIWRSAIRDGKPITIYIPSQRMRSLLRKWIEEVSANAVN